MRRSTSEPSALASTSSIGPTQADDALHEPTIERDAFHGAFRQDDVGIDEQCRKQLRVGHGRVERAGGGAMLLVAEQLEAFYTST